MSRAVNSKWVKAIFFGNYFYGLCAVGLSIEASLQQEFPLNTALYYLLVFMVATFYYTLAYMGEPAPAAANSRSEWYRLHKAGIKRRQLLFAVVIILAAGWYLFDVWQKLFSASAFLWFLLLLFPAVAAMYYGINIRWFGKGISLRSIGWLKPFVIGFTWAGFVTLYPVVVYCIENGQDFEPVFRNGLLFVKNFMFVSVLCILFDIKDYATDANKQLKTFVVNNGLRKTIFYIIIPLSAIGLGSFLVYATAHGFSTAKILLNVVPFLALISVAYSLYRRRPIIYYLVIIDGLMLLKALCGSVAMVWF